MRKTVLALLLALAACAGTPEQRAYGIADGHARWLDGFEAARRACESAGGVIVQERHRPDGIRIGGRGPEVNTRYWCRR